MASSRIFVKGIPPTISEADFQRHFSARHATTDVRIFPSRRIGYVGYKSPEDATAAVKYFNRTFMKMSRLAVELARPVVNSQKTDRHFPIKASEDKHQKQEKGSSNNSEGSRKRKRGQEGSGPVDQKLEEFLSITKSRSHATSMDDVRGNVRAGDSDGQEIGFSANQITNAEDEGDCEYQALGRRKLPKVQENQLATGDVSGSTAAINSVPRHQPGIAQIPDAADEEKDTQEESSSGQIMESATTIGVTEETTDADWLRSKTSRLLGLLEDDEDDFEEKREDSEAFQESKSEARAQETRPEPYFVEVSEHSQLADVGSPENMETSLETTKKDHDEFTPEDDIDEVAIRKSGRLFLRNLSYDITEDELRDDFSHYGELDEVHIPVDHQSGRSKGVAFLQYSHPSDAIEARRQRDAQIFQGRLLHILPAAFKRTKQLDEFEISKLPLKTQNQIRKKSEAAKFSFSWNSLYMNADAVMSSVSDKLGVNKADLLDPTSSDAAVKQAIAETHVINETKAYFADNGVDLEAFKRSTKGDTAILVKNFTYGTKADELKRMFEEHGTVVRMLVPPTGTIAIVEFATAPQARAAFGSLSYRKLKDSVLFLEKAPKNLFRSAATVTDSNKTAVKAPTDTSELLRGKDEVSTMDTATLFVRNLNFSTTSKQLSEAFKALDGFLAARVKTKSNPRKPQEPLSMGFGFLEFRTKEQAQAALITMDGQTLDGHQLVIRASQKSIDAADDRRRKDRVDRRKAQKAKVVIKNLPFETSKKDIQTLLRQYGQLRTVRVPRKFDNSARGFAFAEFTTPQEATNAIEALRNTHLLGRKMVMDYAEEDPEDAEAEIEKIAQKVADKTNKVSLQKMIGGGRRKFDAEQVAHDEAE